MPFPTSLLTQPSGIPAWFDTLGHFLAVFLNFRQSVSYIELDPGLLSPVRMASGIASGTTSILYTPTEEGLRDIPEFTERDLEESLRARSQALGTIVLMRPRSIDCFA